MKIKAGAIFEIVVNLLLPWLLYRLALPYAGTLGALYASAAPPLAWSTYHGVTRFASSTSE